MKIEMICNLIKLEKKGVSGKYKTKLLLVKRSKAKSNRKQGKHEPRT